MSSDSHTENILRLVEECLGKRDYEQAVDLLERLAFKLGAYDHQYRKALPYAQRAHDIAKQYLGEASGQYLQSLFTLGGTFQGLAELSVAEEILQRAVRITQTQRDTMPGAFAVAHFSLATLYADVGKYSQAEKLMLLAKKVLDDNSGLDPITHCKVTLSLGSVYETTGLLSKSAMYLKEAVEQCEEMLADSTEEERTEILHEYVSALINTAVLQHTMGEWTLSLKSYEKILGLLSEMGGLDSLLYAQVAHNFAELHRSFKDYHAGLELASDALRIRRRDLGSNHPLTVSSVNNLAGFYFESGLRNEGEELIEQCVNQSKENKRAVAIYLGNLASMLERDDKNKTRVKTLYEESLELLQNLDPEDKLLTARFMKNYAHFRDECYGSDVAVGEFFRKSVEYFTDVLGDNHVEVGAAQVDLAVWCIENGQYPEGYELLKASSPAFDKLAQEIPGIGSDRERDQVIQHIRRHTAMVVSLVCQKYVTDIDCIRFAFEIVLRRKALGLQISLNQKMIYLSERYKDFSEELKELAILSSQIMGATLSLDQNLRNDEQSQNIDEWVQRRDRIQHHLAQQIFEMSDSEKDDDVNVVTVAAAMPSDSALIEIVCIPFFEMRLTGECTARRRSSGRYIAFVLTNESPGNPSIVDLGPSYLLDEKIAEFRSSILVSKSQGIAQAQWHGHSGLSLELQELFSQVKNCKRLFLSPDGELNLIPFELLEQEGSRLAIEDFDISYMTMGREVLSFGQSSFPYGRSMIIADPNFDLEEERHEREITDKLFLRLPGTAIEAARVQEIIGDSVVLSGDNALKSWVRRIRSPKILHVATHGYFYQQEPEDENRNITKHGTHTTQLSKLKSLKDPFFRSGLVLAGANLGLLDGNVPTDAGDGLLSSEDVSHMDLKGTQLVVASACLTGVGDIHIGEGVAGLRRAFILAGAETVLSSLWRISDLATAILMVQFYQNLFLLRRGRQESLREAQLFLRNATIGKIRDMWLSESSIKRLSAGNPSQEKLLITLSSKPDSHKPFKHPRFWGGFICHGNPFSM